MAANRGEFKLFDSVAATGPTSKEKVAEPMDVADQESTADDAKEESSDDLDEVKKPPIDLFKSIFLDSSSDEEEDDADNSEPPKAKEQQEGKKELFGTELEDERAQKKPWEEKKENRLRNPAPAAGIFANVDFDKLNRRGKPKAEEKADEEPAVVGPVVPGAKGRSTHMTSALRGVGGSLNSDQRKGSCVNLILTT